MQTMSKIYKNFPSSIVLLFFLFSTSIALATELSLDFESFNRKPIKLTIKNNLSRVGYAGKILTLDSKSKKLFSQLESISVIGTQSLMLDTTEFIWLFVRVPSRDSQGKGYCGAGTEDYVYLFSIKHESLNTIKEFQVQSCLKNFSIGVDEEKDINEQNKIFFDKTTGVIEFVQDFVSADEVTSKKIKLVPSKSGIRISEETLKNVN
jgi:hypothetical protein